MPRLRQFALLAMTSAAALLSAPSSASACIFNPAHYFSPFPPCEKKDDAERKRLVDANKQLLGKFGVSMEKIAQVKKEIQQWNEAYEDAHEFSNRMAQRWGEQSANPLPSMVAEYNRSSQIAKYVRIDLKNGGGFVLTTNPLDLRPVVDSVMATLKDSTRARLTFPALMGHPDVPEMASPMAFQRARNLAAVQQAAAFKAKIEPVADSLTKAGNDLAGRYKDWNIPGAESEARISRMTAAMTRLRATSVEAQTAAARSRTSALGASNRYFQRMEEEAATRTPFKF